MLIERDVIQRVEQSLSYQAAVALLGPRQVGKTTIAMQVGKHRDALYIDLEDERDRARLQIPICYWKPTSIGW